MVEQLVDLVFMAGTSGLTKSRANIGDRPLHHQCLREVYDILGRGVFKCPPKTFRPLLLACVSAGDKAEQLIVFRWKLLASSLVSTADADLFNKTFFPCECFEDKIDQVCFFPSKCFDHRRR